jgi:hypothetical protein
MDLKIVLIIEHHITVYELRLHDFYLFLYFSSKQHELKKKKRILSFPITLIFVNLRCLPIRMISIKHFN